MNYRNCKNNIYSVNILERNRKLWFFADSTDPNERYNHLTETFQVVNNKSWSSKSSSIYKQRNEKIYLYQKQVLRNNFWKNQILENDRLYKNQRNKWVYLRKKCLRAYFKRVTENGIVTNKTFCKFIQPFLRIKSCHEQNNIILIKNDKIVSEEKDLVETLNKHLISIVGMKHKWRNTAINLIIKFYENHPSIAKIKQKTEET